METTSQLVPKQLRHSLEQAEAYSAKLPAERESERDADGDIKKQKDVTEVFASAQRATNTDYKTSLLSRNKFDSFTKKAAKARESVEMYERKAEKARKSAVRYEKEAEAHVHEDAAKEGKKKRKAEAKSQSDERKGAWWKGFKKTTKEGTENAPNQRLSSTQ
ncbi:hypothetical protein GQ43DRAFT_469431 [Delitschia confertaspora ATCC 74209]|uniref:Uncharacterized protein n=1 Tax=Delitschia confertaspora ATCC 74209 TaxID=1513339 RepID=A0A9P4MSD7_9PLEO|nr:hypothetical protein GQ43DRAFT_469431 [Delitschia confertaspora ATCC 74209]